MSSICNFNTDPPPAPAELAQGDMQSPLHPAVGAGMLERSLFSLHQAGQLMSVISISVHHSGNKTLLQPQIHGR